MADAWGPNQVILDRYRLESVLGRGGMGSVWRAEHLLLKSEVAIKLLDPAIAEDPQMLARFMREAQSAASLRSPHVVQIFDYGVQDGTAYIAMELLNGESLNDRIARVGRLGVTETGTLLGQVLRAVSKAHEAEIVHRDLKPDNIFICHDDVEYAKVLDFGVAKVGSNALGGSNASKTQSGVMLGTPYYMSPEQTQAKEVDQRADVWAMGVIAFECLTGTRPFEGGSFGELIIAICTQPIPLPSQRAAVPPGFDEWFVKATQRTREKRFQSAREMADELLRICGLQAEPQRTAPMRAMGASPGPVGAATPAGRGPGPVQGLLNRPGQKLELTTGSASVAGGLEPRRGSAKGPLLLFAATIAVVGVLGAGAFMFRSKLFGSSPTTSTAEPAAEPRMAPLLNEPANPPSVVAEPSSSASVAPSSGAPSASSSSGAAATQTDVKTPAARTARASRPSSGKPAEKTPAKGGTTTQKVPVKRELVPPKEWEF